MVVFLVTLDNGFSAPDHFGEKIPATLSDRKMTLSLPGVLRDLLELLSGSTVRGQAIDAPFTWQPTSGLLAFRVSLIALLHSGLGRPASFIRVCGFSFSLVGPNVQEHPDFCTRIFFSRQQESLRLPVETRTWCFEAT